jgi:hypothetical protein
MTRLRYAALPIVLLLTSVLATQTVSAQQQTSPVRGLAVPLTGTADNGATLAGTFTIQRFERVNQAIHAIGTITGVLTVNGVGRNIVSTAAIPLDPEASGAADTSQTSAVVIQQVACEILHLELGPLDLDLLGLVVHLDPVVLDIQAQPGPGNLLGNLLCAVVGLLDGGGALQQIISGLNQILSVLG